MSRDYQVRGAPARGLLGGIPTAGPELQVSGPAEHPRRASVRDAIARSIGAPQGVLRPVAPLEDLQGQLASVLERAGIPLPRHLFKALPDQGRQEAAPEPDARPGVYGDDRRLGHPASHLSTTDGHPIHLSAGAHDPPHHAMSSAGHREAAEIMRQVVKLLFHLRDAKQEAGDPKGALFFDREARHFLELMEGHNGVAGHKESMQRHAEAAAQHGHAAAELAGEITGGLKDHIGIAEYDQARAHPRFPEYVAHRHRELVASDGVRHAALAAMGREGGSAHPVELNQFLAQHGHDYHGLSEDPDAEPIQHDPEKARLSKAVKQPTDLSAYLAGGGRIARVPEDARSRAEMDVAEKRDAARRATGRRRTTLGGAPQNPLSFTRSFVLATLRRADQAARLRKTLTGPLSVRSVLPLDDPRREGGRIHEARGRAGTEAVAGARNPSQNQGVQIPRVRKALDPPGAPPPEDAAPAGDDLVVQAHQALQAGDEAAARSLITRAMAETASDPNHPQPEADGAPAAAPPPDGRAGRDADGDGRVAGRGQSDELDQNPEARTVDPQKASLHDDLERQAAEPEDGSARDRLARSLRSLKRARRRTGDQE